MERIKESQYLLTAQCVYIYQYILFLLKVIEQVVIMNFRSPPGFNTRGAGLHRFYTSDLDSHWNKMFVLHRGENYFPLSDFVVFWHLMRHIHSQGASV